VRRNFSRLGVAFLFVYPILIVALLGWQGSLKWVDNFGVQILIYVMLAWGLNIVVGLAGLLDLGYVAFYAVGAYSYAILSSYFGLSFWLLLPLAGIFAATWGVILGFPVLRLRGDYLAIVTLAFGEIIRLVLINWTDLTKGTFGISGIAKATFFGLPFNASKDGFAAHFGLTFSAAHYKFFLYYVILLLALLTAWVTIVCAACRLAVPGKRCAKMKSPAVLSASTPPQPSSRLLLLARCSVVLQVRSLLHARVSLARNPSCSLNRLSSSPSLFLAAWALWSALPLRRSS
jgi:ABC-type branched-subunit amino acid transport system permease subunit